MRHLRTPVSFMTRSISPARPGGEAPSAELGLEMLADSSEATSSTKAFTWQAQAILLTQPKSLLVLATYGSSVHMHIVKAMEIHFTCKGFVGMP